MSDWEGHVGGSDDILLLALHAGNMVYSFCYNSLSYTCLICVPFCMSYSFIEKQRSF